MACQAADVSRWPESSWALVEGRDPLTGTRTCPAAPSTGLPFAATSCGASGSPLAGPSPAGRWWRGETHSLGLERVRLRRPPVFLRRHFVWRLRKPTRWPESSWALVRPAGLEPATCSLEGCCSIHLSYGRAGDSLAGWNGSGGAAGFLEGWSSSAWYQDQHGRRDDGEGRHRRADGPVKIVPTHQPTGLEPASGDAVRRSRSRQRPARSPRSHCRGSGKIIPIQKAPGGAIELRLMGLEPTTPGITIQYL